MRKLLWTGAAAMAIGILGQTVAADQGPVKETIASREDYRIGIEDVLSVVVGGEDRSNVSAKLSLSQANDIQVEGYHTLKEASSEFARRLQSYIKRQNYKLMLAERKSSPLLVLGEVNQRSGHFTGLRKQDERITIDSPPIVPLTDADVPGSMSDGVLMAAPSGATPLSRCEEAVSAVTSTRIVGAVLDDTHHSPADRTKPSGA